MTTPSAPRSYDDITVKLANGTTIYLPAEDMTRLAPAVVCAILQRLVDLRRSLKLHAAKIPADVLNLLERAAAPVPLESEFTSGDIVRLHNAICTIGEDVLDERVNNVAGRHFRLLDCCGCLRPHLDGTPGKLCEACEARAKELGCLLTERFTPLTAPEFTEHLKKQKLLVLFPDHGPTLSPADIVGPVPKCAHQYEVSSPADTVEVCIHCGDRRPV